MNTISMKTGLWFYLEYQSNKIAVHVSCFSGKEVVYLNDHPISEKRKLLSFNSQHEISIDGENLIVDICLENPFTYKMLVSLKKGRRVLTEVQQDYFSANVYSFKNILIFILGCFVGGYVLGYSLITLALYLFGSQ